VLKFVALAVSASGWYGSVRDMKENSGRLTKTGRFVVGHLIIISCSKNLCFAKNPASCRTHFIFEASRACQARLRS
jgi:hypothetical protein